MFSFSKIKERLEAQEKHRKKRYAVDKGKKKASESFISIKSISSAVPSEASPVIQKTKFKSKKNIVNQLAGSSKDSPEKKLKKKKDRQPSWRFYNKLTSEEIQNSPEQIQPAQITKVKKNTLKLHKTLNKIKMEEKEKNRKQKLSKKLNAKNLKLDTSSNDQEQMLDLDTEVTEFYNSLKEDNVLEEANLEQEVIPLVGKDLSDVVYSEEESHMDMLPSSSSKYTDLISNNKEEIPLAFDTKESKLYLSSKAAGDDSLLVALFPNTEIYVNGYYRLKLVLGSISVFGYKFRKGEEQVVFSPSSHASVSINISEGVPIKTYKEKKLQKLGILSSWVQLLNIAQDEPVVIIKMQKYQSNMTRLLSETNLVFNMTSGSYDLDLWKELAGVHLIEDTNLPHLKLLKEFAEWNTYSKKVEDLVAEKKRLCFVIAGGKSVGKSTLLKYLINTLLSNNVPEVACIDLDPGVPEFSLPSTLSLSVVKSPVLGPLYFHGEEAKFSFHKQVFLGEINVENVLWEYLDIATTLMAEFENLALNVPLVVNTMGFTSGTGFDIMVDVLRIIRPTHVIELQGLNHKENYPQPLHSNLISKIDRGIMSLKYTQLDYDLSVFKTKSKRSRYITSKLVRDLNITSYLSRLWYANEMDMFGNTCIPALTLDWTTVAVHVQGSYVPPSRLLLAINASLVVLCRVDQGLIEEVGYNLPLKIQDSSWWFKVNECLGWGIVRGIDPITRNIHILTPLSQKQLMEEVNVIAKPQVHLPINVQKLFATEDAPYWQKSIPQK